MNYWKKGTVSLVLTWLFLPQYTLQRPDTDHSTLRARWENGAPEVMEAIQTLAQLAERGKECLLNRDYALLSQLMDRNFNTRSSLVELDPANVEMVELARSFGLSAKNAGSGGSIIGICESDETFHQLQAAFSRIGCMVIRPQVN